MLRQRLVRLYEHVKHVPKFQASWPLLKALWPKKFQALNVQSLKFFHVIFPVVLWLHSHLSFFHYKSHSMECESMLFVTNHTPSIFEAFQILFPTASLFFTATKLFHQVIRERKKHKASTASHP